MTSVASSTVAQPTARRPTGTGGAPHVARDGIDLTAIAQALYEAGMRSADLPPPGSEASVYLNHAAYSNSQTQQLLANLFVKILQRAQIDSNASTEKKVQKLEDMIDASIKASRSSALSRLINFFKDIAAPILMLVAAVATVLTFGVASPLALAAIAMCVVAFAQLISEAAGGPSVLPSDIISDICEVIYSVGMSAADAKKYAELTAGAIGMALSLIRPELLLIDPQFAGKFFGGIVALTPAGEDAVMMVTAICTVIAQIAAGFYLMNAAKGAVAISDLGVLAAQLTKVAGEIQVGAGIVNGALGVASGGLAMDGAVAQRSASEAQADAVATEAQRIEKQHEIDAIIQFLQAILDLIDEIFRSASEGIQSEGETQTAIASNIAA